MFVSGVSGDSGIAAPETGALRQANARATTAFAAGSIAHEPLFPANNGTRLAVSDLGGCRDG
jgi:hypothetical protein